MSPLDGTPPSSSGLRPLPSTTAGLRSTFDRLPFGCLLLNVYVYRLDLTSKTREETMRHCPSAEQCAVGKERCLPVQCTRRRKPCEGLRLFPLAQALLAVRAGDVRASGMSDRTRGFLIGGAAVFLITPDALLCRLAGANESVAVVTFWRSAFICALCCVITSVGNRGVRRLLRLTRDHCRPLLFIGAISSVTSLGFPLSFMMTGSAEALLIISLNPLWAGVIGWWFLGDVLPLRTRLALAGATASIMLIFVPRVLGVDGRTSREQQPNRLAGDALAFVTGLSLASAMNAMRYYRRKHTQLPAQVVQIIASGTVTLVTAPFCSPSIIPREPGSLLPTAVAMAACISIAYLGFNIAPKYITAADFGILTLVERYR